MAVQVKSVEGTSRRRVKLERVDAENILRTQQPFCLIAIETKTCTVYHKFLTEDFINQLHQFLKSERETLTFALAQFSCDDTKFRDDLVKHIRPRNQLKLHWMKKGLDISSGIPGGRLVMHKQSSAGDVAIVEAPWITSFLEISPEHQEAIAANFFEKDVLPSPDMQGVTFKKEISSLQELIDGQIILAGGYEGEETLTVYRDDTQRSITCGLKRVGDERAYISKTGLILVFSDPRENDNATFIHNFRYAFTKQGAVELTKTPDEWEFLKLFVPGSCLQLEENDGFSIEEVWPSLLTIGKAIASIELVYRHLDLSLDDVYMYDLYSEEFEMTRSLLDGLIQGRDISGALPGFIFGLDEQAEISEDSWVDIEYRVPIVANLKKYGIIIWVEGAGQIYVDKDIGICGFRPKKQDNWSYEVRNVRFDKAMNPEAVIYSDWPCIPLFRYDQPGKHIVTGEKPKYNFEAKILWPDSD